MLSNHVMALKSVLQKSFDRLGYRIQNTRNVPPFLLRGEAVLQPRLEFLLSYQYLLRGEKFSFVQIGAYDGLANDPLAWFVEKTRCRGILIEPQVGPFAQLQEKYRHRPELVTLNMAISESASEMEFYTLRKGASGVPTWAEQLASFRKDVILSHQSVIPNIEELIEVHTVPCLSLGELFDRHGIHELDLLQMDTEGYDAVILKSLNWSRVRPAIIQYEHKHLSWAEIAECTDLLVAQGYQVFMHGEDTTAFSSANFPPQVAG